jgi:hypothetical protein
VTGAPDNSRQAGISPAPEGYGSPVPWAWLELLANHRVAQNARAAVKARSSVDVLNDEAVADYARAVDAMVAAMDRLAEDKVTGRITAFLSKKERG